MIPAEDADVEVEDPMPSFSLFVELCEDIATDIQLAMGGIILSKKINVLTETLSLYQVLSLQK